MRNDYLYKKLKHTLALNVIWNVSKHHLPRRHTMLWAFKQFQVLPMERDITSVEDYSYVITERITLECGLLWLTRATIVDYATKHGIAIYDMMNGEVIHA